MRAVRSLIMASFAYRGPAEDFALVIPVPTGLREQDFVSVSPALFDRLDLLTAPRLDGFQEGDPCPGDQGQSTCGATI